MSDEQEKTGPGTIEAVPTEMYERQNNVFSEPMEILHKLAPEQDWNLCRIMRDQFQAWFALYCGDDIAVAWAPPIRCAERIYSYARGVSKGRDITLAEWADDSHQLPDEIVELLKDSFRQMAHKNMPLGDYDSMGISTIDDVAAKLIELGVLEFRGIDSESRTFYRFVEKNRAGEKTPSVPMCQECKQILYKEEGEAKKKVKYGMNFKDQLSEIDE